MKLRYVMIPAAAIALGLVVKRRPGVRQVRAGAIEEPLAAQFYARATDLPPFRLLRWIVTKRAVAWAPHGPALDVGSGPGKLAAEMAEEIPHLEVHGIDPSDEMIQIANQNARQKCLEKQVHFWNGRAEGIPFPEAQFDVVVSTMSLHHWSDPVQGLREVARVLRPGGHFLILDFRRDLAVLPWFMLSLIQRFVLPSAARLAGEPTGSVRAAYTPTEVAQMAAAAGLPNWHVTTGPVWLTVESGE